MTGPLPLLITYIVIGLNVTVDQMQFEKSPYSESEIYKSQVPILSQISKSTINEYLDRHKPGYQLINASQRWRILRYNVSGHMIPHKDEPRPVKGLEHIGTEIYVPPATQVQYGGGQLVVKENKKVYNIVPHPTQWTYVLMPLGLVHKVNKVTRGYRISYTKSIYVREKIEQPTPKSSGQL